MNKKLFLAPMLAALSIMLGACSKNDSSNSLANPVNNQVTANKNSADANKQSGGQVTIINGSDKGLVKVRSTEFR